MDPSKALDVSMVSDTSSVNPGTLSAITEAVEAGPLIRSQVGSRALVKEARPGLTNEVNCPFRSLDNSPMWPSSSGKFQGVVIPAD